MNFWLDLLKSGFSHQQTPDPLSGNRTRVGDHNWALLTPYLHHHHKKALLGAVAIVIAAALGFVTPLLTRFLVDDVILTKHLEWLIWAVLGFAAVKGLRTTGSMVEQYTFGRLQAEVAVDLQKDLIDHTLKLPKAFFDEQEEGYLISRIASDAEGLTWFFSQTSVYIITNIIQFIGGMVFLFVLEWRLAIAAIIVLPLLIASVKIFSTRMSILGHRNMEQHANVYSRFTETLASIPLIKSFATEQKEAQRVVDEVKAAKRIGLEQTVVGSTANAVFNLVPDVAKALVLVAGAYLVIKGNWTLGSLLAFQSYLGFIYGPALSLSSVSMELQSALAALDRVNALIGVEVERNSGQGKVAARLQGKVQFDHVFFSYDGQEAVLSDVSFNVNPGETVAIVGPSGVGKSTLISLLLRFYRPLRGRILFDELDADDYEVSSLRQRIGYVSQSTQLLAGSIRECLSYGNTTATKEEIEHAAAVAGIIQFIEKQPEKFDFQVGEKGVNLSEGQKQRLSIGRALIKDPDILIFDEPTSALDAVTENSILQLLPEVLRGKTLFIAAHRLSTIKHADRILILNNGRVTGIGTHAELLDVNEYYRSLFTCDSSNTNALST